MSVSQMQDPFYRKPCQYCARGKYVLPPENQEWHLECDKCGAVFFCYVPMPHQYVFHQDRTKFKMFAGGYGSAKTSTGSAETLRHTLRTKGGMTLIGASTLPQLEQTAQLMFMDMLPVKYIKHHHKQKNYLTLFNNHRVLFRPLDDEGKAKSLNLSKFWIEEGSEVKYEYFVQLQARLRRHGTDFHQGVITTNPDRNWIKTEILLKAGKIFNSDIDYYQKEDEIDPNISVHIAPTYLNIHLPPNFYEDTGRGKPEWWINRNLHGSFENPEGLVYPQYAKHLVEPFEIPAHWQRGQASDFGLANPTSALWFAIDPESGTVYVYDEHYEARKPVHYHAMQMRKRLDQIHSGLLLFLVGDPKGQAKSENDMRSTFDHYAEYGVYFQPATNKVADGIQKVYNYFDLGRLKIFKTCVNTIEEIGKYRYPEQSIDSKRDVSENPIDKDDHAMDCLKYGVAELPDDPNQLINPSYGYIYNPMKRQEIHALSTDEDIYNYGNVDWYHNF